MNTLSQRIGIIDAVKDKRERERERESACVCVYMCARV